MHVRWLRQGEGTSPARSARNAICAQDKLQFFLLNMNARYLLRIELHHHIHDPPRHNDNFLRRFTFRPFLNRFRSDHKFLDVFLRHI